MAAALNSRPGGTDLSRLGLGTVQFGLDYGVSNDYGKCDRQEVGRILGEAERLGIRVLDTAPSYGDAEEAIGRFVQNNDSFQIVSKTRPLATSSVGDREVTGLIEDFESSCHRLARRSLFGFMIHHAEDLLKPGGQRLWTAMQRLRDEERVSKIGVSVYDAVQIDAVLNRFEIDLVQLPLNVFDQRLIGSGHLQKLKEKGVEIHARSIFLQGLLLMDPAQVPVHFDGVRLHIERYHHELKERQVSLTAAALNFVRSVVEIDKILIGVVSVDQLRENVDAYQNPVEMDYRSYALDDPAILNPQHWRLT